FAHPFGEAVAELKHGVRLELGPHPPVHGHVLALLHPLTDLKAHFPTCLRVFGDDGDVTGAGVALDSRDLVHPRDLTDAQGWMPTTDFVLAQRLARPALPFIARPATRACDRGSHAAKRHQPTYAIPKLGKKVTQRRSDSGNGRAVSRET